MTSETSVTSTKSRAWPIFLAFVAMGFGDAAGPFVSLAREHFRLTNFAAQLVPFAGLLMFGILSVPMGVYQDIKGKKFILMLGLCIMLAGLADPHAHGALDLPRISVDDAPAGRGRHDFAGIRQSDHA